MSSTGCTSFATSFPFLVSLNPLSEIKTKPFSCRTFIVSKTDGTGKSDRSINSQGNLVFLRAPKSLSRSFWVTVILDLDVTSLAILSKSIIPTLPNTKSKIYTKKFEHFQTMLASSRLIPCHVHVIPQFANGDIGYTFSPFFTL